MTSDIFARSHKANARDAIKKQIEDAKAAAKQATAKKMLDNMKPVFNDLKKYKFKDVFKFSGPR